MGARQRRRESKPGAVHCEPGALSPGSRAGGLRLREALVSGAVHWRSVEVQIICLPGPWPNWSACSFPTKLSHGQLMGDGAPVPPGEASSERLSGGRGGALVLLGWTQTQAAGGIRSGSGWVWNQVCVGCRAGSASAVLV